MNLPKVGIEFSGLAFQVQPEEGYDAAAGTIFLPRRRAVSLPTADSTPRTFTPSLIGRDASSQESARC
jgi:hypothetical protein